MPIGRLCLNKDDGQIYERRYIEPLPENEDEYAVSSGRLNIHLFVYMYMFDYIRVSRVAVIHWLIVVMIHEFNVSQTMNNANISNNVIKTWSVQQQLL